MPVYDEKYIKTKVREFNGIIKVNFLGTEVPREGVHYTHIACITIDSVIRIEQINYPLVYPLKECKHKIKKVKKAKFIGVELDSNPSSDSEWL